MNDPDDPSIIFGALLREAREAASLSQKALAERMGSTQAYISRAERGLESPPLHTLVLFAEALDGRFDVRKAWITKFDTLREWVEKTLT